jgi:class I lanthipeptide synthase
MSPATPVPRWHSILEGDLYGRARDVVAAIAAELVRSWPAGSTTTISTSEAPIRPISGHCLADGEAGQALFFAALAQIDPDSGGPGIAHIERAIDQLSANTALADLYSGFTGVAWAIDHLRGGLLDEAMEDTNEDIDHILAQHLLQSPWKRPYDLTSGLTGLGLYALERLRVLEARVGGELPAPQARGASPASRQAVTCLERVIDRLDELALRRPDGITWHTSAEILGPPTREYFPNGHQNLGVAHGVPGILPVLARTIAAGVAVDKARPLLDGAVRWVLAQRRHGGESMFPYCVGDGVEPKLARAAWCYGDPGIAAALLVTARAVGEPVWEQEARAIAMASARRSIDSAGVHDAGLCHGAAGLGHVFNRLYQATREPLLLDAARTWFAHALALRRPDHGIAGFRTWGPGADGEMTWLVDPTFLTGVAGIGLALLGATTDIEPIWDRLLLISPVAMGSER